MADLVAAGLTRPGAIAFNLAPRVLGGLAGVFDQIGYGPFPRPAARMQPRIDHNATGAEQRALQPPKPPQRQGVISPQLVGQLFGVQRPALVIGVETQELEQGRHARRLVGDRALQMVARQAFVIGGGRNRPARPVGRVVQIEIDGAGPGSIDAAALGIGAGRAQLQLDGHAPHLQPRFGQGVEHPRQARLHVALQPGDEGQQVRPACVRIGKSLGRIVPQRLDALRDRAPRHPVSIQNGAGLGRNLGDLIKAQLVRRIGGKTGGGVKAQSGGVIGLALGQGPHPRLGARAGPQGRDGRLLSRQSLGYGS